MFVRSVFTLLAAASASVASAAPTVGGVQLGKTVSGPDVAADALKGKVVVLELWGRN